MLSLSSYMVWCCLGAFSLIAFAIDLFGTKNLSSDSKKMFKFSIALVFIWTFAALLFWPFVSWQMGHAAGLKYITSYVLERFLSFDNIFVFLLIFNKFSVPPEAKNLALFWGIVLAILMRGVFIYFGIEVIERFSWVLYIFAAFLVYSGIKIMIEGHGGNEAENEAEDEAGKFVDGFVVRSIKKLVPVSDNYQGERLFTRIGGKFALTPLCLVVVVIGFADVVFALDSIPAVFGITTDPFIVISANVFSLLGLRSIFFFISEIVKRVHYLGFGLAVILVFIGLKIALSALHIHINEMVALLFVVGVICIATLASYVRFTRLKNTTPSL